VLRSTFSLNLTLLLFCRVLILALECILLWRACFLDGLLRAAACALFFDSGLALYLDWLAQNAVEELGLTGVNTSGLRAAAALKVPGLGPRSSRVLDAERNSESLL
jgi:hypothetical protein